MSREFLDGDAVARVLQEADQAARRTAWDSGYIAGVEDTLMRRAQEDPDPKFIRTRNPYRVETQVPW